MFSTHLQKIASLTKIGVCLLIFICVSGITNVSAQLVEIPNLETIAEKEGLPFNTINIVIKDHDGFIWVGSSNGLARYDGYTFQPVRFVKGSANSLPNNSVISLSIDPRGMLWIGHIGGYITRLDPRTFKIWSTRIKGSEEAPVKKIFCDSKSVVWCYLDHVGMFRLGADSTFQWAGSIGDLPQKGSAPANAYNIVRDVYEDADYIFWLGSENGIYRFNPADYSYQHISSLDQDKNHPAPVYQIIPDGKSKFWCATYGSGIVHYSLLTKKFDSYLFETGPKGTHNVVEGIAQKNDHELLVAGGGGIGAFNTNTYQFKFYLPWPSIVYGNHILKDAAGICWIVSNLGLVKWNVNENRFVFSGVAVTRDDNHSNHHVSDVLQDEATGRMIVGTELADGLHIFEKDGKEFVIPIFYKPQGEPYQLVRRIIRSNAGDIYVLSRDVLYELTTDNKLREVKELSTLFKPDQVPFFRDMIVASNGDLWITSSRNGVCHYNTTVRQWENLTTTTAPALAQNGVPGILEDAHGKIWLGYSKEGVGVLDPERRTIKTFRHADSDSTSLVSHLFSGLTKTPNGEIWIATLEGLSIFNEATSKFTNLTMRNILPDQVFYSIISDEEGNVWASTNGGIMRIGAKSKAIKIYNFKDGLQGIYSDYHLRPGPDHHLYAVTAKGFYTFSPLQLAHEKSQAVPVYITGAKNLKTSSTYLPGAPIKAAYHDNSFSIDFAALNYLDPSENIYRYRMEGLEDNWTETSEHIVTYAGLPSGSYKFKVQLKGNVSNNEGVMLINIETPFWKRGWFRLMLIIVAAGGVYLAYLIRLRMIRAEEEMKTDFNRQLAEVEMKALKAQMSPHFIFNSLNSINRYIVKSEPETASLYLTKFSRLIRLILENSNNKIISLDQELTALKLYIELEALRFDDKFTYAITIEPALNPLAIAIPPMIIQPFVENAIWHGLLHKDAPGHLDIVIRAMNNGVQCIITDNGVGRKKAEELKSKSIRHDKSFGLKITKERLNMLKGNNSAPSVEIIDLADGNGVGIGTQVIVRIVNTQLAPEF